MAHLGGSSSHLRQSNGLCGVARPMSRRRSAYQRDINFRVRRLEMSIAERCELIASVSALRYMPDESESSESRSVAARSFRTNSTWTTSGVDAWSIGVDGGVLAIPP
jgi:hypothetical protein